MISYLALLDVCKQINDSARFKKQQRNVSVIQDIDGNNIVVINDINKDRLHHEIYMSDARKAAPEKWKTVIRHPIKKA